MRQKLLQDRYFAPGETEECQIYHRVARSIYPIRDTSSTTSTPTRVATDCATLYQAMCNGVWLPNSPTLANAGVPNRGGLSACYVLPIEDSLDGIYKTVHDAARVHKAFGGTGFNFSHLREEGAPIKSTGGKACGPIKVMKLLNMSADVVSQGGKRQGANMGILNASHPDIRKFINCKADGELTHFNISVGMTDEDMKNEDLLTSIAQKAWATGDPGIIFLDRIKGHHIDGMPDIECTNPCGEQPLRSYESCNLGSINLSKFPEIVYGDCADFLQTVEMSIRALDAIIDINTFPIREIEQATLATRKIGSGIMGWADWLIENGISYQSDEATLWAQKIGSMYMEKARVVSHQLAIEKGNYPAWGNTPYAEMRNETLLTIAPTGTLSYLAGCSWGIEPIFDWDLSRTSEAGTESIRHPLYNVAASHRLLDDVAHKIDYHWQIQHVAAWQKNVDNGASKTINMPSTATVEDVLQAFKMAHRMGLKGITVYRDGSKQKQAIVSSGSRSSSVQPPRKQSADPRVVDGHNVERFGSTIDFNTGCGRIHVTCNERDKDSGVPFECYILSDGGCPASNEALGKVISKYLHDPRLTGDERATVQRIVKTLRKVDCPTAMRNPKSQGKSCADIIAKRLEVVWPSVSKPKDNQERHGDKGPGLNPDQKNGTSVCPQCGEPLDFGSGCRNGSCRNCSWSGCS